MKLSSLAWPVVVCILGAGGCVDDPKLPQEDLAGVLDQQTPGGDLPANVDLSTTDGTSADLVTIPPLFVESNAGLDGARVVGIASGPVRAYAVSAYRGYVRPTSASAWTMMPMPTLLPAESWTTVTVALTNNDVLACGTDAGRVFLSNDQGQHWNELADNRPISTIQDLALIDTTRAIAITVDAVFRWNGSTWTNQTSLVAPGAQFSALSVDGDASGTGVYLASSAGVYRYAATTDAWTQQNGTDSRWVATVLSGTGVSFGVVSSATGGTLIFEPHDPPPPTLHTCSLPPVSEWHGQQLLLFPSHQFVTDGANVAFRDLYCAMGAWSTSLLAELDFYNLATVQINRAAKSTDSGALLLGTSTGAWWSTGIGTATAWEDRSVGLHGLDISAMAGGGGKLYAATRSGLFQSTTGGVSWTKLNGTGGPSPYLGVRDVVVSSTPSVRIYLATVDNRLFWTDNGGTSFTETSIATGPTIAQLAIDSGNRDIVYACGSSVYRTNNGKDFVDLADTVGPTGCQRIAVHPGSPAVLWVVDSGNRLWRSGDRGDNFDLIRDDGGVVNAWAFDPADANRIIIAQGKTIYDVRNGVAHAPGPVSPSDTDVYGLALDPSDSKTIYLGLTDGVWRSTTGVLFEPYSAGLPQPGVSWIGFDPLGGSTLFVGLFGVGLWRSIAN